METIARRYFVRGHVQGVGFRYFVKRRADGIGVTGWVRNLDNGDVEVYAAGTPAQLNELEGWLQQGPSFARVRSVDTLEAAVERRKSFSIEH